MNTHMIAIISGKYGEFILKPFDCENKQQMIDLLEKNDWDVRYNLDLDEEDDLSGVTEDQLYSLIYGFMKQYPSPDHQSDICHISKIGVTNHSDTHAVGKNYHHGYENCKCECSIWNEENQKRAQSMIDAGLSRVRILKEFEATSIVIGNERWPKINF